jgi:hypothetical protein
VRTSAGARQTEHGAGRAALKLLLIFVAACLALFGLLAAAAELFVPGLAALALAALAALGAVRLGARKAARRG